SHAIDEWYADHSKRIRLIIYEDRPALNHCDMDLKKRADLDGSVTED
ncbi:15417_t:CDS:1, partial [Dentiscutata heterogama]